MWEELDGEFCIEVFFNDCASVDKLCMCICLRDLDSGQEWLLIDTKSVIDLSKKRRHEREKNEDENEGVYLHRN
jgi:hypothetical protein